MAPGDPLEAVGLEVIAPALPRVLAAVVGATPGVLVEVLRRNKALGCFIYTYIYIYVNTYIHRYIYISNPCDGFIFKKANTFPEQNEGPKMMFLLAFLKQTNTKRDIWKKDTPVTTLLHTGNIVVYPVNPPGGAVWGVLGHSKLIQGRSFGFAQIPGVDGSADFHGIIGPPCCAPSIIDSYKSIV